MGINQILSSCLNFTYLTVNNGQNDWSPEDAEGLTAGTRNCLKPKTWEVTKFNVLDDDYDEKDEYSDEEDELQDEELNVDELEFRAARRG